MDTLSNWFDPLRRISIPRPNATLLLFVAAVLAIVLANTPLNGWYEELKAFPISVNILGWEVFAHHGEPLSFYGFVNDFLMAIFFLVVGLEIKQEMTVGELSSVKKSLLPIIAAFGGMIVPVLCFLMVVQTEPGVRGAATPMATDIAFALALIAALGSRVPSSLRIFLMALAVVDDIGGIIIIALFYSSGVVWTPLLIAFGVLLFTYLMGRLGVEHPFFYFVLFFIVWQLFMLSGIHATISGVLIAFCIPMSTRVRLNELGHIFSKQLDELGQSQVKEGKGGATVLSDEQLHLAGSLKRILGQSVSPVQRMEHLYSPMVSFAILPLFAFVNAGVALGGGAEGLFGVPLAIFLGLFPGKAIGITLFTWVAIKLGICPCPNGMTLKRLIPLSVFGGVGFTVSLFIASLAYGTEYPELLNQAKMGIFAGTILSGLVGYIWLGRVCQKAG